MTATDEMRRMLDERGVEWERGLPTETIVREPIDALYVERPDGRMHVYFRSYLAPKQAIAATLGRGECKPMTYDNGYSMDRVEPGEYYEFWEPACACSKCGELIPMRRFCPNCGAKIVDPTTNDVDGEVVTDG